MQQKGLIALLAVTAVAVVLAVVSSLGGTSRQNPLVGSAVLPDLAPHLAEIERIGLVQGGQNTTLARQGDSWVVEERGGYPADAERVRHLLFGLAELSYVEPKTADAKYYSRLELDDAAAKGAKSTLITVAGAKGALLGEIIAGKRKYDELGGGNDGIYLRKPGDAQSWLARGSLDLPPDTAGWLDKHLLDIPAAQVREAAFLAADGSKATLIRDKPENKFRLVELPKDKKPKSDDALQQPPGALGALELTDVKPAKDFAFPASGVAHARFTTFDGLVVTVDIADRDKTSWARFGATGTGNTAAEAQHFNDKVAPWVVALPSYKADLLKTKLANLLAPPKSP